MHHFGNDIKNDKLYPALAGTGGDYRPDPNKPIKPIDCDFFYNPKQQLKIHERMDCWGFEPTFTTWMHVKWHCTHTLILPCMCFIWLSTSFYYLWLVTNHPHPYPKFWASSSSSPPINIQACDGERWRTEATPAWRCARNRKWNTSYLNYGRSEPVTSSSFAVGKCVECRQHDLSTSSYIHEWVAPANARRLNTTPKLESISVRSSSQTGGMLSVQQPLSWYLFRLLDRISPQFCRSKPGNMYSRHALSHPFRRMRGRCEMSLQRTCSPGEYSNGTRKDEIIFRHNLTTARPGPQTSPDLLSDWLRATSIMKSS